MHQYFGVIFTEFYHCLFLLSVNCFSPLAAVVANTPVEFLSLRSHYLRADQRLNKEMKHVRRSQEASSAVVVLGINTGGAGGDKNWASLVQLPSLRSK
jgi:hypothetical protein